MRISDTLQSAYNGVTVNAARSLLTMLGIIIGVASVVLMSAVGESMSNVILSQISSLGPKSMVIFPGQESGGPPGATTGHDSLTMEDVSLLKKLPTIVSVAPILFVPGTVSYGGEDASPQVMGVPEEFFTNQNIFVAEGRLLDQTDDDGGKFVAVIAPDTRDKLFGSIDPIGKRVTVGERKFTVVGVTKALGSQFFQNVDNRIYVPFSVAETITGQSHVNFITLRAKEDFDVAFADIKSLLRQRHAITNPEEDQSKDDFVVRSSQQANQILSGVSLGLTMFITTIAGISLLVGGIGIMNIMLVSVTERTREIGLRKAVGALKRDILRQFLAESVVLTLIGGCIGLLIGIVLAWVGALVAHRFLDTYAFAVSLPATAAALLMAALTGLVFGISPARKAAELSPIEALRYE